MYNKGREGLARKVRTLGGRKAEREEGRKLRAHASEVIFASESRVARSSTSVGDRAS